MANFRKFGKTDTKKSGGKPSDKSNSSSKPFKKSNSESRPSSRNVDSSRRSNRDEKPRFAKDEKPRSGTNTRSGSVKPRFNRDEKPRFDRSDRPNSDKPRFDQDEKPRFNRDEKPRFDRSDRPNSDKPRFDRDEKPRFNRDEKPRFDRNDRPNSDKPRFNRDEKPRFERNDRPNSDKPRFERDEKPRFNRDEKPRFERNNRPNSDKPRFDRDEKPGFKRDEKPRFDRTSSQERYYRKPPIDKGKTEKSGFSKEERPRKNKPEIKTFKPNIDRQVGPERPPRYDEASLKAKVPERFKNKVESKPADENEEIRLNKYISNAGLCSRREADELIESGMIKVNGEVITEMGYRVKDSDTVKYGKDILSRERMMYILLNKPKDFLTTMDDPQERKTVMDLVSGACRERVYPVGRLDRNTTGLLLLTNDGELTVKLTHPTSEIKKVYQAELDKPISEEHFEMIKEGLELEDGFIKPDQLALVTPDAEVVGIEIHSGKNRIVRRIFEHLGYEVTKLDRTTFAGLTKKDLPRGKWRFLTEKELIRLKYML